MRVKATVTIRVVYDDASSLAQVRRQARDAADHLVSVGMEEGLLSGETDLSVAEAVIDDVQVTKLSSSSGDLRRKSRAGSRRSRR
jgi:hypothetical protein